MRTLLTAICLILLCLTTAQADTYTCKIKDEWFERWYNERYLQIDATALKAKFGTGKKWGKTYNLT
jgi:hypothetical protein